MPALRRFFFDDGSARKRWQIAQQGRTQTVAYGRLGSNLRFNKKTFGSPSAARENAAALIASKLKAGYVEVDPSALRIKRPPRLRAATAAAIRSFEKTGSALADRLNKRGACKHTPYKLGRSPCSLAAHRAMKAGDQPGDADEVEQCADE